MSFQIKKFNSIVASMINWVSSATDRITDFNVGSVSRTLLEAVAIELEELYYQLLRAVEEAIEEAIYRTFNFPRNPAQRATGTVRFNRLAGTEPEVTIPRGALTGTDTDPIIYFETQADDKIPTIEGYSAAMGGLGAATYLTDHSKNWVTEGVHIGSRVKNLGTPAGETASAGVLSITTSGTAPPGSTNDTLTFSALTNGASFATTQGAFTKVFHYDGSIATYTDVTTAASGVGTYFLLPAIATEDYLYCGLADKFHGFYFWVGDVAQAATSDMVIEYYNGSAWAEVNNLYDATEAAGVTFATSAEVYFDYPATWEKSTVNSQYYYWIRIHCTANLTNLSNSDRLRYNQGKQYKVIVLYEDVAVQSTIADLDTNVAAGAVNTLYTTISNVDTVTNTAAFADGRDEESDLERKDRFSLYIQSLARATKGALEYAARTVEQVTAAAAIDDIRPWCYVLDSSGSADTGVFTDITAAMRNPGDAPVNLLPAAEDTYDALYIGATEPFNYVNMHLVTSGTCADSAKVAWKYWNGTTWTTIVTGAVDGTNSGTGPLSQSGTFSFTIPTDWVATTINTKLKMWIKLVILASGVVYSVTPTGDWASLPPGFGYVYLYVHDGSGEASSALITSVENAVELYRGCGITVTVLAPVKLQPTITVSLLVASNYDPDNIASDVTQGIIDWMNTFVLGQDFYLAELYQKIMEMNDKAIINATVTAPTADIVTASAVVIRPDPLTVTVTGVSI